MSILFFYDHTFPFAGRRPAKEAIHQMEQCGTIVSAERLCEALHIAKPTDTVVLLHGPYFPKEIWPSLLTYLRCGGGLVVIGGIPFRIPVQRRGETWEAEQSQTSYHKTLHIRQALAVDTTMVKEVVSNTDIPICSGIESLLWESTASGWGFVVRFTQQDDHPNESGSSGPMDAHLQPLVVGRCEEGRDRVAPVVLLENTKGEFTGGRWIFATQPVTGHFWDSGAGVNALVTLGQAVSRGVTEISIRPNYAMYYEGEKPTLIVQTQHLSIGSSQTGPSETMSSTLTVVHRDTIVFKQSFDLPIGANMSFLRIGMDVPVQSGYYEIVLACRNVYGAAPRTYRQGFWGYDETLLTSGEPLRCGRDYFQKDGEAYPIVGMTYMASDVHRKFLFLPNVATWRRDMAHMKRSGVNALRTGVWTAWREMMFVDGQPSEEVLRAIDAFILTAKQFDLPVTFNFFAFTPELWEGSNPYLDPRSVEAQKRFIGAVVARHTHSKGVNWDLINEPSISNPKRIFAGPQPNRDPHERQAWRHWLRERHPSIEELQSRWDCTPEELPDFGSIDLPASQDFSDNIQDLTPKKGLKFLDYTLFTQHVHNEWAKALYATIRAQGASQLVTVGQDEGLGSRRPSPFFYAEAVDYTTNHTWWLLDDLYWDGIFTKTPHKPNLIQETGIMYVEDANGVARRSESELRDLLERKYAYAFAAAGAGAVHWIWNVNVYMTSENEVNIGAVRADSTEKPEVDVSRDFGAFMSKAAPLLRDRALEDVCVIYPYANDFSVRRYAVQATTKAARVLGYDLSIPFRAMGDYQAHELDSQPAKLIIYPSPRVIASDCWATLLRHVANGSTLLVTGIADADEYWREALRLRDFGLTPQNGHVSREEMLTIAGVTYRATFSGGKTGWVDKAILTDASSSVPSFIRHGQGTIIWCPLPLELADETATLTALYELALTQAQVNAPWKWIEGHSAGVIGRKLSFGDGALYIFVSEANADRNVVIADKTTAMSYEFSLPRERCVLFTTDRTGIVTHSYRQLDIRVF